MKPVLCVLALGSLLASAQTQPAARDLTAVSHEMLTVIQTVKNHAASLLRQLDNQRPDRQAVQALSTEAAAQVKHLRKLIEELDAFYEKMPEAQQSALRRSWSVAMILNGCMESAVDALAGESPDAWGEVRSSAECAQRRAEQLEQVVAPFRRGS